MRRALVCAALPAALAAFGLTGCVQAVPLQAAPQGTSVACAGIVASVSQIDSLSDQALRQTDAQGTAAWGAGPAVTLRCGVQAGISADPCITVGGVDWQYHTAAKHYTVVTTYGRAPATQLVIDADTLTSEDVLPSISDVISNETVATRHCTAQAPEPSVAPTPSPSATR